MKFSVGDKMMIRSSGQEGVIIALLDDKMAEVSVDGTIFPIYIDEIDHPYLYWFTSKNKEKKRVLREQIPVEKRDSKVTVAASGVHLTFIPVFHTVDMEERVEKVRIFLVNHVHHTVELEYKVRIGNETLFSFLGVVQPFSDLYLHYIDWDQMQDIPRFEWRLRETLSDQYDVVQDVVKIRSAKLFDHISQLQQQNLPSFRYTLLEEFPLRKAERKPVVPQAVVPDIRAAVKSVKDIPRYELDLHIEQLVDDTKGLSHADMLLIQLAELERYLRIAVNNHQDRMVVIHGVGKGVLRSEVQKALKAFDGVDRIESGWQSAYGFGATIVYFRY
jgi:hypothetical protein